MTERETKKEKQTWQAPFYRFPFTHSRNCRSKRFEAKKTKTKSNIGCSVHE
jgi:hypothetical protein